MVSPSLNNGALFPAVYLELRNSIFRWMNLEPIIQSEVNQKEKNKYYILTHIYGTQKDGTDKSICRAAVDMQTQRADLWTQVGKERVGLKERVPLKHIYYHM